MGRLRAALFHASADDGRGGDTDDVASLALRVRKSLANLAGPPKARGYCTGLKPTFEKTARLCGTGNATVARIAAGMSAS
jgi:hypothetical protein